MTLGSLMSRGLLFIASIIIARILTVDEYGELGMVKSTMDNFLIFASMGIGLTTTKYTSELKDTQKDAASSIIGASLSLVLLLSLTVALTISFFSSFISIEILNNGNIELPLIIGGFTLVFIALNGTQMGALLGLQAYKKNSISNIVQGVFLFFGLCIGAYFGGVLGAITGNFIAIIIVTLFLQYLLRKEASKSELNINLKNWKLNTKKIYRFAIPASLSTIIVAPAIWILNSMLVNEPNGYKQLGLYSAIIIFSNAIQLFNGSISNVLLPLLLSKTEEITPKKEFFNYFGSWIISVFLSLPLLILPEIVSFILGANYNLDQVRPILMLSVLSTLIVTNRSGVSRDLIVQNKMWLSVFSMGQWAITTMLMFYFLKDLGALGYAIAFLIGYGINYLTMVPLFIRLRISPSKLFYNVWVLIIWSIVICQVIITLYFFENLVIRFLIQILLLTALVLSIKKLYEKWLIN
tara:strand:- start:3177 stop:4574 length:1398 start_codon:yes stop_codon:yes gene_type:complete